ncbi:MAG: hypothetical protein NTW10_06590 [Bacteroidetes bacterium]|nr:hypothetical protein [Bacteroidota bacterium]
MRFVCRFLISLLFLLSGYVPLSAQEPVAKDTFDITKPSMQFPHQYKKWGFQVSAGLSMVKPPKDLLESAIQAPLVNIHATFGLPWKFSLEGDITTILVSNQFALGPRLSFAHRNFGVKIGWDLAFVYGQMRQGGFNNSTQVWIHYPNLSLGYKLKRIAFTVKGEMVTVAKVTTKSGENEVSRTKNFIDGGTAAIYIEQRLHKNTVFVIGLKDNYLKYYWPTWMLFSTFNRYYHIPELYFSWIL